MTLARKSSYYHSLGGVSLTHVKRDPGEKVYSVKRGGRVVGQVALSLPGQVGAGTWGYNVKDDPHVRWSYGSRYAAIEALLAATENPLSRGAKIAIGVSVVAVVGAAGFAIWYFGLRSKWKKSADGSIPAGAEFALSIVGPPEASAAVDGLLKASAQAGIVTGFSSYPVGSAAPSGWPSDDTFGTSAYRATGTTKTAMQAAEQVPGLTYVVWVKS
jgi:hypothetical protein